MADLMERQGSSSVGRRWRWVWVAAVVAAALVAVVLVWFQPQQLFIDERVDEAVPTVGSVPTTAAAETPTTAAADPPTTAAAGTPTTASGSTATQPASGSTGPSELSRGTFISRDHGTSGTVRVLALDDGRRIVRLEDLRTDNGPDLYLYLSPNTADGAEGAFDDGHLNLGRLKGNLGDQNYDIPAGADLDKYRSVVIWCDRFDSAFGAADLA